MSRDKLKKIETKDKLLLALALVIILTLVVIPLSIKAYNHIRANSTVKIEDPGMQQMLIDLHANTNEETGEKESFKYKNLDVRTELRTGSWDNYESIADIAKFKNLEYLGLNTETLRYSPNEKYNIESTKTVISDDKLKAFCNDLKVILKKDKKLSWLTMSGNGERMEDVSFLEYGSNLETLYLLRLSIDDYSGIGECKKIRVLSLVDTSVKTADQLECLKKLDNLKYLSINNTPLSKDENELKKLQEMLPNVEIDAEPFEYVE